MTARVHDLEERAAGLFEPDTLLPSQYFDRVRGHARQSGERRLLIAILEDAVNVHRVQNRHARTLYEEAAAWFESTDTTWVFSFESICGVLGLEPDYIRRGLRAWKRRAPTTEARPEAEPPSVEPVPLLKASGE